MSNTRMRLLGVFYIAEGVSFLAYSAWRLWIQPLEFYRAPPILELLAKIFMSLMFVAGVFYISRAPGIINGLFKSRSPDVAASVLSIPLWFFPALISLGNAATYLTSPYMPAELRPVGCERDSGPFVSAPGGDGEAVAAAFSGSLLRTRSS